MARASGSFAAAAAALAVLLLAAPPLEAQRALPFSFWKSKPAARSNGHGPGGNRDTVVTRRPKTAEPPPSAAQPGAGLPGAAGDAAEFLLGPPYPQPFGPSAPGTPMQCSMPVFLRGEGTLTVEITDLLLRPVASFRTGSLPAGWNAVPFSLPSGEPSGTYFFIVTGARERRWSRISWMR